jgi:hypothetical protein
VSTRIELRVDSRPFERIEADLAVAGIFLDEKPLRGAAGRADWRLCGVVTDLLEQGRLRGVVGEATLVPSMGRLGAERVLLLGLGRRSSFRVGRARDASHAAVRRGIALGARRVVLAPPLGGPDSFARQASGLVRGAIEAVRESEACAGIELCVAMPASHAREGVEALESAIAADEDDAIHFRGLVPRS